MLVASAHSFAQGDFLLRREQFNLADLPEVKLQRVAWFLPARKRLGRFDLFGHRLRMRQFDFRWWCQQARWPPERRRLRSRSRQAEPGHFQWTMFSVFLLQF